MGFLQTLIAPRVSRAEHDARLSEAVTRAEAAESRLERVEEYLRVIANSPMLGMPSPGQQPPAGLGAYAFDRPLTYATPQSPNRKPGSLVSVDTLRILADTYDPLRAGINHLKREVAAVPLEIVAREEDDDSDKTAARIKEASRFFETPGGLGGAGRRRSHFESAWIDDLLVIGARCFYYRKTRGGGLYEVETIDAATIRPKVDPFGWPGPGEKVYQQWVYGVLVAEYDRTEMTYDGIHAASYSPYFKSPVEWILSPIITHLKADEWNRVWLTDGNTPSDMCAVPDAWTPDEIRKFTEWFDDVNSGDSKARNRTKFVPSGTSRLGNPSRKDQDFQLFEQWLLKRVCSMLGVHPAAIGYPEGQYAVTQENSMDQTSTFGAGQILEVRKAAYDDILERLGYPDLECRNVTSQEEAANDRASRVTMLVAGAVMTPNEARSAEGLDSIEGGDELFVPTTLQPIALAINPPEPQAPAPGDGMGGTPNPASKASTSRAAEADPLNTDPRLGALALWQRKALNRMKDGRGRDFDFQSEDIDSETRERVRSLLRQCNNAGEIRAVFANVPPATKAELGARWQRRREEHEAVYGTVPKL